MNDVPGKKKKISYSNRVNLFYKEIKRVLNNQEV